MITLSWREPFARDYPHRHPTPSDSGGRPPLAWRAKALRRGETGAMKYVYFLQLKNGDIYVGSTNDRVLQALVISFFEVAVTMSSDKNRRPVRVHLLI